MTSGPAARFAASRCTWEPIDWWRLEARAWQEVPEADLIVGALYFVVFRRKPTDGSARWKGTVDRLAAAIAALDEDTRARILADVGDAIDELEIAGRIAESIATDARQTPPGMLGARFAPRRA